MADNETEQVQKYLKKIAVLEEERQTWDIRNQDIADYMMPNRGKFPLTSDQEPNTGTRRDDKIINETATYAMRIPIAGMISGLSSPASEWFRITIEDKDLEKFTPVKEWLETVRKGMRTLFQKSNFYTTLYVVYEEEIGFGTAVVIVESDNDTIVRYRPMTAGEYVLMTNEKGLVDTLGRSFHMTAEQMIEKFGKDKVSDTVRSTHERAPYKWFKVTHFIEPNKDRDDRKLDNLNMAYKSIYIENGQDHFLRKSGYEEQPMMAPRWKVTAQRIYGDGLGSDALGSTIMLQELDKESLKAIYKMVDPPMVGPAAFTDMLDVSAGAFNASSGGAQNDKLESIYDINFNVEQVEAKIERVQNSIGRGFFNDLFLFLQEHPQATATEILEKKAEKVMLLGPVITRQQDELFDPMFERTFGVAYRADYFPLPPTELEGHDLEIEYISQLAIAQRLAGVSGIYDYLAFIGQAAEVQPNVVDKFDGDEAADALAEKLGIPPKIVPGQEVIAQKRQARLKAQIEAKRAEDAAAGAQELKDLSQAKLGDENVLSAIVKPKEGE
jgi:hypothetical protein